MALGLLGAASSAGAQRLGGAPDAGISIMRIIAALVVCVAAAFGLILIVRARAGRPLAALRLPISLDARRIVLVESQRLSPHGDVHLVRCNGTEYLLLCGPGGSEVLESRPTDPVANDDGSIPV